MDAHAIKRYTSHSGKTWTCRIFYPGAGPAYKTDPSYKSLRGHGKNAVQDSFKKNKSQGSITTGAWTPGSITNSTALYRYPGTLFKKDGHVIESLRDNGRSDPARTGGKPAGTDSKGKYDPAGY